MPLDKLLAVSAASTAWNKEFLVVLARLWGRSSRVAIDVVASLDGRSFATRELPIRRAHAGLPTASRSESNRLMSKQVRPFPIPVNKDVYIRTNARLDQSRATPIARQA